MHDINRPLEQRIAVELLTSDPHIYYQGNIKGPMVRQCLVALLGRAGGACCVLVPPSLSSGRGPKLWGYTLALALPHSTWAAAHTAAIYKGGWAMRDSDAKHPEVASRVTQLVVPFQG